MLAPVSDWAWEDDGRLRVGCGRYVQGGLLIAVGRKDLANGKVVDQDDDGVPCCRYPSFGHFADRLLGSD